MLVEMRSWQRGRTLTDRADDAGAAELRGRMVLGVEAGEPLHTSAAELLVDERITHGCRCVVGGMRYGVVVGDV
jgi:hypothetical protein